MSSTELLNEIEADVDMITPQKNTIQKTPLAQAKPCHSVGTSVEVQEEIINLYTAVPEVKRLFRVVGKAGEGTFSSVFLAKLRSHPDVREMFALKYINPTSHPDRIEQELQCLLDIGGESNVMGVKLCLRERDHVVIVMPYIHHDRFQDYVQVLSVCEVRDYMFHLLTALKRVHQFNVIHRDIKPSNFLYNRETRQFALVDFGLAQKVPMNNKSQKENIVPSEKQDALNSTLPDKADSTKSHSEKLKNINTLRLSETAGYTSTKQMKSPRRFVLAKRMNFARDRGLNKLAPRSSGIRSENSLSGACRCFGQPTICRICKSRGNQNAPRAGTPGFRSPEVLLKYPAQTTAVDIWSAGVIFLSLLSGRYPFFRANDDMMALAQIISVMGSNEVKKAAKSYGKTVTMSLTCPALNLKTMCCKLRRGSPATDKRKLCLESWHSAPDWAFDLLVKLLDLDPAARISADEALTHQFFNRTSCYDYGVQSYLL